MSRLNQLSSEGATGRAKELLGAVKSKLGLVPNMMRAMANAPAVLDGYLQFSGALSKGTLSVRVREQIALAVDSAIGKAVGLTAEQIHDSRLGTAIDPKADALIRFATRVVQTRGQVSD